MIGQGVGAAVAALRFSVIAHLLGPEQLGLAAILMLIMQFFDMITDAGMDRFLVQNAEGNNPRAQNLIHLVSVVRGCLITTGLYLLAGQVAEYFNQPRLVYALQLVSVAPAIQGFLHYDVRRSQREHDFAPEGWLAIAELISLVALTIAAFIVRDCTALSYALVIRAVAVVVISHVNAKRPYRLAFSPEFARSLSQFGMPLMLNGILLFAAGQGDRMFVARQLTIVELGHYSAILMLISYPSSMILKLMQNMFLPVVSRAMEDQHRRGKEVSLLVGETLLTGTAMLLGYVAIAPVLVPILFGWAFAQYMYIFSLIGTMQIVRFIRLWPVTMALAAGRTHQVLFSTILRLLMFPAAFAGQWLMGGMKGAVTGFIVGELISVVLGVWAANRRYHRPNAGDMVRLALFVGFCTALTLSAWTAKEGYYLYTAFAMVIGFAILLVQAYVDRVALWVLVGLVRHSMIGRFVERRFSS